ncbi:MAG: TonB-dependent receptor [Candidatus Marinimicrobia bacterium]|nr:TonB-dependent receptor [Candidatus Neomarinimicrobiota bacterium]MCF7903570.1 TonB-dependent receptor [Candidatus Neomarinimicrobiota bacterium]
MRILLLAMLSAFLFAEQIQVVDQKTAEPLPGVNITLVGTTLGMNTDMDGFFTLNESHQDKFLKFSYIGYLDTVLSYQELVVAGKIGLRPDVLLMEQVEIQSSKLEWEQTDLPSIVTVLPVQDVIQQGSIGIKEVLRRDPSVVVGERYDGEQDISIRGSNANEVLIVFDDIPLNSSYQGAYDLSWINLNDIETVSIIKGAGTLQYGSGAFGGVIVLKPIKRRPTGFSLNFQNSDQDLQSYNVSGSVGLGPLNTRLSYSSMDRQPFGPLDPDIISTRNFINLYTTWVMSDTASSLSANLIDIKETVAPQEGFMDTHVDQYIQFKYSTSLLDKVQLNIRAMQRVKTNDFLDSLDSRFHYVQDSDEQKQLMAIENRSVFRSVVNFMILELQQDAFHGLSETRNIYWDHLDEQNIDLEQQKLSFTNILKFRTELEVPFVDFLGISFSYRREDVDLDKLRKAYRDKLIYIDEHLEDSFSQVTKRTGVTLDKKRQNLRYQFFYTAGTNFRHPTLYEYYLRDHTTIVLYMDSPLESELNASSELGVQASIQPANSASIFESFDLQASYFKNRYINKIYYTSVPRALPTPVNAHSAEISGYELSGMLSTFDDRFRLYLGRTSVDISSFTIFPNKPEFRDVAEVELRPSFGNLRIQYFHEGKQLVGGTGDNINWVVTELAGRENVNLYLSIKLKPFKKEFSLGGSVLNLLSADDELSYFKQRRWTVSIGVKL